MTKIKIILPDLKISEEQREKEIRALIKDDFERKEGLLAKVLVFTYLNNPLSITELTNKLKEYYQKEFDRSNIFRVVERLVGLGLLFKTTSGYVQSLGESERKPIHDKILEKHRKFLDKIPVPFRQRYNDVNYIWISNGIGTKYLEWCCKLLNFKYVEE